MDTALPKNQLTSVIHGVLRYYDLPDLEKSLNGVRIQIEDRRDAAGS
jgi:hypothetical protein